MKKILFIIALTTLLTACGQTGKLVLPASMVDIQKQQN